MKKKKVIIAGLILLLVILLLGLFLGWPWEQHSWGKKIDKTANTVADTMPPTKVLASSDSTGSYNSDSTSSYNMDSLVINQARTIDSLVQLNLILVKKIKCQERSLAKKVRRVKPKRRRVAVQKPKPKPVIVKTVIVPAKKQTPQIKTTAQNNNLDEYRDHDGKIYFCVDLGGSPSRYLPHLALMRGEKFPTVVRNNDGGWNWVVETPSAQMSGDYGVTTNGIFFVSKSLIEKFLKKSDNDLVEIKTTATDWQKKEMSLSKDGKYYIYKP